MSYSQGSLKTEYLDPVSFTGGRCAFNLDATKMAFLPNMRLLNLGCDNSGTDAGINGYSAGLGAIALIKNIRIMDARTELSAMRNVAPYAMFKNFTSTNDINQSLESYLKLHKVGFEIDGTNNKVAHLYDPGYSNQATPAGGNPTHGAYVDLRQLLPVLNSIPLLPTSIFKNLRIEIEFNNKAVNQVIAKTTPTLDMLRPILAVDYLDDDKIVSSMMGILTKGVQWNEIEWDNYQIPTGPTQTNPTDTNVQSTTNSSLGFRGKMLDRLLVCKTLVDIGLETTTGSVLGYGAVASSQALLNEKFQIRLNGKNVFPGHEGVSSPNQMLGTVVDAYGDVQQYPGSNLYLWDQVPNILTDQNLTSQAAWDCCEIGARVADLQLSISRTNNADATAKKAPTNNAIQVNMYAEVRKVITFQNGGYSVIYV